MKTLLLLPLCLWLGLSKACAQPTAAGFELRGRVIDAENRQGVPNAQIGVGDNRVGTSTNADGRFVLRVPAAYARTALDVAMLGYQRYRRPLAELAVAGEVVVLLRPVPAALGEVTVAGSVTGIIREALARIPQHYAARPTWLSGFLRESDATATGQPLFVAEATLQVLVPPYTQPGARGQVRLEQSRKVDLRQAGRHRQLNWVGGPFVPLRFDFVRTRAEFIQPARFADYAYRVADLTHFNGESVYVISFAPRPGNRRAHYTGKLYIGVESYVFFGAEATRLGAGGTELAADSAAGAGSATTIGLDLKRTWKTTYQPYGGKWHLKEVHYRVSLDATEPLVHTAAFFTTALDTANDRSLAYAERMQYGDVFLKNSVAFDSAFWRHYVPPLPDAPLQQALAAQAGAAPAAGAGASATTFERAQAAARPPARWRRCYDAFWRRLSLTYAVGMVPVTAGENAVSVAYAPGGPFAAQGSGAVPGRRASAFTSFGYQFEVVRGVFARYASLDVRGAYGQGRDGWQVGLGYQHNLSRQRRPVYLRASLSYTHLVLGRSLGAFDNPDRGVRLAGTTLNARRLAWALQTRREAWQPQLGLAVELNHRYDVFLDAGYLLERSSRTELSVRETSGFFLTRSNAVQPLPATGAELRINDAPATEAPWQPARLLWQFGVARRFR